MYIWNEICDESLTVSFQTWFFGEAFARFSIFQLLISKMKNEI